MVQCATVFAGLTPYAACVGSGKKRYVSSKRKYVRLIPSLGCLAVFKLDSTLVPTKVCAPLP